MKSTANFFRQILIISLVVAMTGCSERGDINGSPLIESGAGAATLPEQPDRHQKILVIGGTSGVGLEVVRLALARGHTVTAASRHPENMTLQDDRLSNVKGDILDFDRMKALVDGQDAIVSAIGMGPTREPVTVFSRGMENVIEAIPSSSQIRIIAVTGIGAGESRGHGGFFYDRIMLPLLLKTVYEDKERQEAMLREGSVDWTIVRPGFLTNEEMEQQYRIIEDMRHVTAGEISRADVAHFIVSEVESGRYSGKAVLISN
jgi:putative NADH-flavin reductase